MTKPTIIILIDWYLPGYKAGGPVSSIANLVQHLNSKINFYILTRNTEYLESIPYSDVMPNVWQWYEKYNAYIYYISNDQLNRKNISKIISDTKADSIYINGIYSWYFSILPLIVAKKIKKRTIVAARGMLSGHAFSSKSLKKKLFLRIFNLLKFYSNTTFQATNDNEANEIHSIIKKYHKINIIPNLPRLISDDSKIIIKSSGKLKLISIARISIEKNTKFIFEVLNNNFPGEIEMHLYGSIYNKEYWAECEKIKKNLPGNVKIEYKNSIKPDEIPGVLRQYHFSFMPSMGENFGHGHLESMLCKIPVITSDNTPWRNMESKKDMGSDSYVKNTSGWDISLDNPEKFRSIINYCLGLNQDDYSLIAENAKNYALKEIKIDNIKKEYLKLFYGKS